MSLLFWYAVSAFITAIVAGEVAIRFLVWWIQMRKVKTVFVRLLLGITISMSGLAGAALYRGTEMVLYRVSMMDYLPPDARASIIFLFTSMMIGGSLLHLVPTYEIKYSIGRRMSCLFVWLRFAFVGGVSFGVVYWLWFR